MKLKILMFVVLAAIVGITIKSVAQDAAAPKDGKAIFLESKCINCHQISSLAIESKKKSGNIPDLSGVGLKRNADFIKKFITKEEEIDGKKHAIAFKGEAADLDMLAKWLETLKTEVKKEEVK